MVKYIITNDGEYLTFTGIQGSTEEGEVVSHQKDLIKQILDDDSRSALLLVEVDDHMFEYIYYEVINPVTGFPYTSLESFRLYVLTALNSSGSGAEQFIDTWDAVGNQPVLASGALYDSDGDDTVDATAPNAYYFIVVNADPVPANNTTLDGENAWTIGDLVRSTGTKWVREIRVDQVAAINVSYVNAIGAGDPAWEAVDNAQEALDELYTRVANFDGTLTSLTDTDVVTNSPSSGDGLVWNGSKWVPGAATGITYIKVVERADGTIAGPAVDGNYQLTTGTSNGWVPAGAAIGDILNRTSGSWTILADVSNASAGTIITEFTAQPLTHANYIWNGSEWEDLDAYEPATSLDSINVSNPNLGDISTPPYGAPVHTGLTLRGRSISKILDDILFQTVPADYNGPIISLSNAGGNFERGTQITSTIAANYTKNDGGNLNLNDPSYIGGSPELDLDIVIGSYSGSVESNSSIAGNRSVNSDLSFASAFIPSVASAASVGAVTGTARTADGADKEDNKGTVTPKDGSYGDNVLAQVLTTQQQYYSRYPIWFGTTTERFKISNSDVIESSTITIDPNSGSNAAGLLLDDAWIKSQGDLTKQLFTSNLSNNTGISTASGDSHILIMCPPGISVQSIEALAGGSWLVLTPGSQYENFTLDILSANDDEPKTYNCYYARSLSALTYTATQFRFTTSGTIQS